MYNNDISKFGCKGSAFLPLGKVKRIKSAQNGTKRAHIVGFVQ